MLLNVTLYCWVLHNWDGLLFSADSKVLQQCTTQTAKKIVDIFNKFSDSHQHYDIYNVDADLDWDRFQNQNGVLLFVFSNTIDQHCFCFLCCFCVF